MVPSITPMTRLSVFLSTLLLSFPQARGQFEVPGFGGGGGTKTKASLVSEAKTIAPGKPFTVALGLEHPEHWHSYYQNTGGVELPPKIEWTLPQGFSAGPIQWPVPEVIDGYAGKSFVYQGSPAFLVEITPPGKLEPGGSITLEAKAGWQICKESCIDEQAELRVTIATGAEAHMDPETQVFFAKARAALPAKPEGIEVRASEAADHIVLRVRPAAALGGRPADFVPDQPYVGSASSGGEIVADDDAWEIRLPRVRENILGNAVEQGSVISGILTGERPVRVMETAIATAPPREAAKEAVAPSRLLRIMTGMFLGGLILNLMPCVFPVIGLKIMGFVQQAGAQRAKVVMHGLTFALGVLASFGVLSGVLFAARAAAGGASVGWGYQLQNPWVVLALMLLMFLLALNMYGVFEIGASATSVGGGLQSKHGLAGSFFSGVLATVVATPCSAPFLGAAIGAAIALPAVLFFSAFTAMALGLALPYLLLSVFPKLIDFLPRPGAWMESFKQAMSFLLFATAGYLLWVYAGQIGLENLLGPVFGLTAIAIAAWIYGRWNLPHRAKRTRVVALGLAALLCAGGFLLAKPPQPKALVWEEWSEQRVAELLEQGRPVYIDFTAQWCATCQLNKRRAYNEEVVGAFVKKNVATLKADKTRPNPAIETALEKLGRSAIPVNVLMVPGKEPVILPELLSPADVLKALDGI